MPARPDSSTAVGKGGPAAAAAGSSAVPRGRKPRSAVPSTKAAAKRSNAPQNKADQWQFYTEDSPGIKVGPVPVLVMSLVFIASVFMLHIWAKFSA